MATFLLANYVAHAATVKSLPGEPTLSVLGSLVFALFFPVSGIVRGVNAVYQRAIFAKTPLEAAAKASALCMVVRTPAWKPEHGNVVEIVDIREPQKKPFWRKDSSTDSRAERLAAGLLLLLVKARVLITRFQFFVMQMKILEEDIDVSDVPAYMVNATVTARLFGGSNFKPSSSGRDPRGRTVHGVCQLPSGYALSTVPSGSHVVELDKDQWGGEDQPGEKDQKDSRDKGDNGDQGDDKAMAGSRYSRFKTKISSKCAPRKAPLKNVHSSSTQLSSINNFAKGLIAIFQTLYASFTLYQARGDQIQHYGYAAFGLTGVPYIVMSIINLASIVLTPDYSMMYLVESEAMEEARKREDAKFEGVVGRILRKSTSNDFPKTVKFNFNSDGKMFALAAGGDAHFAHPIEEAKMDVRKPRINLWTGELSISPSHRPCRMISRSSELPETELVIGKDEDKQLYILCASLAVALIPIAVNGALSHFKSRQSSHAQRVWTMTWLAFGIYMAPPGARNMDLGVGLAFSTPAIGGFVVVSQMIMQYGSCVKLN